MGRRGGPRNRTKRPGANEDGEVSWSKLQGELSGIRQLSTSKRVRDRPALQSIGRSVLNAKSQLGQVAHHLRNENLEPAMPFLSYVSAEELEGQGVKDSQAFIEKLRGNARNAPLFSEVTCEVDPQQLKSRRTLVPYDSMPQWTIEIGLPVQDEDGLLQNGFRHVARELRMPHLDRAELGPLVLASCVEMGGNASLLHDVAGHLQEALPYTLTFGPLREIPAKNPLL